MIIKQLLVKETAIFDFSYISPQIINVTNHTYGKVTIQWNCGNDRTFSVMPMTMDIPPLKSCAFQVTFKPVSFKITFQRFHDWMLIDRILHDNLIIEKGNKIKLYQSNACFIQTVPNQFYGAELECFAYYKSLRDYRLVEDNTHSPPWCLTLTCAGRLSYCYSQILLTEFKNSIMYQSLYLLVLHVQFCQENPLKEIKNKVFMSFFGNLWIILLGINHLTLHTFQIPNSYPIVWSLFYCMYSLFYVFNKQVRHSSQTMRLSCQGFHSTLHVLYSLP